MEKDRLKLALLEKIIACDDVTILKRVEEIILQVSEAGENYGSGKDAAVSDGLNISPEQEEELMRRFTDYLQNKEEALSWEEVKQNIRESHGF